MLGWPSASEEAWAKVPRSRGAPRRKKSGVRGKWGAEADAAPGMGGEGTGLRSRTVGRHGEGKRRGGGL